MGTISRINDIINSNIHSILERAEEPEKIVRLMIAKIQEALADVRSRAARAIADKKELERRLRRFQQIRAEWQAKAEQAITNNREDLAKAALLEKIKLQEAVDTAGKAISEAAKAIVEFDTHITKLQEKLREARAKYQAMYKSRQPITPQPETNPNPISQRMENAVRRLEGIEKRLDATEGMIEAYDLGTSKSLIEEFEGLEVDDEIMAELAALKESVSRDGGKTGGNQGRA